MPDTPERVLFRKDKDGGEIVAIFPDMPENPGCVACFAHIGQHAQCSRLWYRQSTIAARPAEYADLKRELESPPYEYKLRVMKRWPKRSS